MFLFKQTPLAADLPTAACSNSQSSYEKQTDEQSAPPTDDGSKPANPGNSPFLYDAVFRRSHVFRDRRTLDCQILAGTPFIYFFYSDDSRPPKTHKRIEGVNYFLSKL